MSRFLVLLAAAALAAPAAAVVQPAHVYALDNALTDAKGGPSLGLVNGALLGSNGVSFTAGQGLSLTGSAFASAVAYSVAVDFRFDSLPSLYARILNTSSNNGDRADDGLYIHHPSPTAIAQVDLYSFGHAYDGGPDFTAGPTTLHHIFFTRDATTTSVYLDGGLAVSRASADSTRMGTSLLFFLDDSGENAPGFVDSICTYSGSASAGDAGAISGGSCLASIDAGSAVPEPISWAMMVGGFGFMGAAMRRRRGVPAAA